VDRLAKEAAVEDGPVVYDKMTRGDHNVRKGRWTSFVTTAADECGGRGQ
jgi:hypothetical protein